MSRREKGVTLVPLIDRLFGPSLFSLERDLEMKSEWVGGGEGFLRSLVSDENCTGKVDDGAAVEGRENDRG